MKVKVTLKCRNCNLKENSFLFDTDIVYPLHFRCSECKSEYSIKVEEYEI